MSTRTSTLFNDSVFVQILIVSGKLGKSEFRESFDRHFSVDTFEYGGVAGAGGFEPPIT